MNDIFNSKFYHVAYNEKDDMVVLMILEFEEMCRYMAVFVEVINKNQERIIQ